MGLENIIQGHGDIVLRAGEIDGYIKENLNYLSQIRKAVRKALSDDEWEMREIAPGRLEAKHSKRGKDQVHTAVIEVAFTGSSVRISYKDSQNLNYDAKDNTIHGTYNKWVKYLEKNIRANLGAF